MQVDWLVQSGKVMFNALQSSDVGDEFPADAMSTMLLWSMGGASGLDIDNLVHSGKETFPRGFY
jgi:hypothetical protein